MTINKFENKLGKKFGMKKITLEEAHHFLTNFNLLGKKRSKVIDFTEGEIEDKDCYGIYLITNEALGWDTFDHNSGYEENLLFIESKDGVNLSGVWFCDSKKSSIQRRQIIINEIEYPLV